MSLLFKIKQAHSEWFTQYFEAARGPFTEEKEALWRSEYIRTWGPLIKAVQEIEEYLECRALVDGSG